MLIEADNPPWHFRHFGTFACYRVVKAVRNDYLCDKIQRHNVFVSLRSKALRGYIFDVDLVVGHREGNPVSFFSLLPNPMKMINFALKNKTR